MRVLSLSFLLAVLLTLPGCVKLTLAWADLHPEGPEATPTILNGNKGLIENVEEWQAQTPIVRAALQSHIYGDFPDDYDVAVLGQRTIDENAFNNAGNLKEYKLKAKVRFGETVSETSEFYMNVVTPSGKPNAPIILMQTFCPRWDTIPHPEVTRPESAGGGCANGGVASSIATYIFGRYIATPPIEMILEAGYGIAAIFPSEYAPDSRESGMQALEEMAAGLEPERERWGAIAAWAWGFSLMIDALEEDPSIVTDEFISWGHSRYGKSALLAAAFDDRIDGVISHQSGTGGASLNREKKGESVKAITDSYPHWFAESYASYAGREEEMPIDQHHLLALIAPRPVLLGNARRDVWSDPNGAFRAAMGADAVYELYGSEGLKQKRLNEWAPDADIAFWIRPGTHGVVKEDWPAFLEFLSAHFAAEVSG